MNSIALKNVAGCIMGSLIYKEIQIDFLLDLEIPPKQCFSRPPLELHLGANKLDQRKSPLLFQLIEKLLREANRKMKTPKFACPFLFDQSFFTILDILDGNLM